MPFVLTGAALASAASLLIVEMQEHTNRNVHTEVKAWLLAVRSFLPLWWDRISLFLAIESSNVLYLCFPSCHRSAGILGLPGLNLGYQACLASPFTHWAILLVLWIFFFFILAILIHCLVAVLTYISLIRNNTEHHFVCLLGIHNSYSFW
jgi:apolipoprotein N-acyltransferase